MAAEEAAGSQQFHDPNAGDDGGTDGAAASSPQLGLSTGFRDDVAADSVRNAMEEAATATNTSGFPVGELDAASASNTSGFPIGKRNASAERQASSSNREPTGSMPQASPSDREPTGSMPQTSPSDHEPVGSTPKRRRPPAPNLSTSQTDGNWNQTSTSSLPHAKSTGDLLGRSQSRTFCSSYGLSPSVGGGVLKRSPFLTSLSRHRSMPKITFSERGAQAFPVVTNHGPGPGSYNSHEHGTSKFRRAPASSTPHSSRFGFEKNPAKKSPAPGDYEPKNPVHHMARKVGFSTAPRGRPGVRAEGPGPGAYETRKLDGGPMFKQKGRYPVQYAPTRAQPGPGQYSPKHHGTSNQRSEIQVGFGTSAREDFIAKHAKPAPGPGLYDVDKCIEIGRHSAKFSILSRPRDPLNYTTYVTPAPGWYDNHATSFGY